MHREGENRSTRKINPLGTRTRTNNKLNPHMTPSPGIEPEIGGRRVLSPLRHRRSPLLRLNVEARSAFSAAVFAFFMEA